MTIQKLKNVIIIVFLHWKLWTRALTVDSAAQGENVMCVCVCVCDKHYHFAGILKWTAGSGM